MIHWLADSRKEKFRQSTEKSVAALDSPRKGAKRYPAGPAGFGGSEEYKRSTRSPAAARSAAAGDAPRSLSRGAGQGARPEQLVDVALELALLVVALDCLVG